MNPDATDSRIELMRTRRQLSGFTLIELMTTIAVIGLAMLMVLPKLKTSERSHVRLAAHQIARDLELVRTRALATRSAVRVDFNTGAESYAAFLDDNQDGVISGTLAEVQALRAFGERTLDNRVVFGMGSAPRVPGDTVGQPVTFASDQILFNNRGLPEPFGIRGFIYVTHMDDAASVSAVSVAGSGSFRTLDYTPSGGWQ